MEDEIAGYLNTATDEDRTLYEEYYGNRPPIVGEVYIRLCRAMERRKKIGLHDSDKFYANIFATVAKQLNVSWKNSSPRDFIRL